MERENIERKNLGKKKMVEKDRILMVIWYERNIKKKLKRKKGEILSPLI